MVKPYKQSVCKPLAPLIQRQNRLKTLIHSCIILSASGLFYSASYSSAHADSSTQQGSRSSLDWVAKEQLSEQQAENCPSGCKGAYIAPERTDPDARLAPSESPIRGEADASEINTDKDTAWMRGDVVFTQGWRQLQSDRVEIDRARGSLKLQGAVSIREPGLLLLGDSAYIDSSIDQVEINNAQYLFHEQRIRGSASHITRSASAGIAIDNASYTACEPGDEAWVLYARQIKINEQTGRASAKGVRIETSGVPVFYAPYFQFIVDDRRATGLLYPSVGFSDDEGFEYSQPVYLNISPNHDLTLTPRITTRRSSGLEAEHRILTRSSFTQSAGVFFADDDVNPQHNDQRWAAAITHRSHRQRNWGNWATEIDFAAISDDDFLEDWDTRVVRAGARDTFLRQHAGLSVSLNNWTASVSATDYQSLIDDDRNQYRELPRISLNGHYEFANNLRLRLNHEWVSFDREQDDLLVENAPSSPPLTTQVADDGSWITGDRTRASWLLSWNQASAWGFIKPEAGVNYLSYDLDSPVSGANDKSPDTFAPEASLDAGLRFERNTSLFGHSGLQTLEPRLYYLYRDSDSQSDMPVFDTSLATESLEQLFRSSRFIGGDRLEDASQLSLGIWSRFYDKDSSREVFSLGIGQSYYLRYRQTQLGNAFIPGFSNQEFSAVPTVAQAILISDIQDQLNEQQRDRSDIVTEAVWALSDSLTVKGSLFWNDQQSELERSRFEFSYRPVKRDHYLRLAYIKDERNLILRDSNATGFFDSGDLTNEVLEQVTVSGQWTVNDRWKLHFLWREDLENSRNLDKIAGVSYQSCCWNLSLSWRSELTRIDNGSFISEAPRKNSGLFLRFEFSGLGGLGTSGQSLIENL